VDFKIVPMQLILFLFNQINKRVFSMGEKKDTLVIMCAHLFTINYTMRSIKDNFHGPS
jgi:hypothetical protein